jgi:hypothetical protein
MSTVLSGFAASLVDPDLPVPPGIVGPRGRADNRRFAVYRNNVHVSLVGALEARFPVVRRLVGEAFFAGMARVYVAAHKPHSPILMHYGDTFGDFIAGFSPARAVPYLADMARLEARWSDAYNAADAEPVGLGGLAAIAPDRLGEAVLRRHPAAALVSSAYAIGSIWAAHQHEPVAAVNAAIPETVLLVRPHADVRLHVLPTSDVAFARALLAGEPIGQAAMQLPPGSDAGAALVGLVSLGAFAEIESYEEQGP